MRSGTSWFNLALYKKNLTRFWPVWACYGVIWLFFLPLNLLFVQDAFYHPDAVVYFADQTVLHLAESSTVVAVMLASILAAMAVFSYLYNSRSAGMMHALPMRREGLFLTNYLSGLTFLAGPAVISVLLTLAAEAALGYVNAGALCMLLAVHLLLILFFYSFAVFCAMFTGHILALPAFYGILNILALGIASVVDGLLRQFLYGYNGLDWISTAVEWLTPTAKLGGDLWTDVVRAENGGEVLSITFHGLSTALVFAALGLVLAALALVLYRRRQLETAGDVVSVSWVRPVFKFGVGACAALAGGTVLYYLFQRSLRDESLLYMLVWFLPCGALGYFVAEMLLQKSFRVFSKWKGCAVLLVGLTLVVGCVYLDPMGFSRWTPDPAKVSEVYVGLWGTAPSDMGQSGFKLTDPADIALAAQIQEALNNQKGVLPMGDTSRYYDGNGRAKEGYSYTLSWCGDIRLEYTFSDGSHVQRRYEYLINQELLDDPASHAALMTELMNRPTVREQLYSFPSAPGVRLVAVDLPVYNTQSGEMEDVTVPTESIQALYAAVQSDLAAGRLGRRFLMDNQERMEVCYYNDLSFGFYSPEHQEERGETYPTASAQTVSASKDADWSARVTLQTSATDTLGVLERLGVLDETHTLLTVAEYEILFSNR